jgi:hypothetical protein
MAGNIKKPKSSFFCPLGHGIMWWRGFEYKECPLGPSYRDMPECKNCKLRVDKKWEDNKKSWKPVPVKKKKRKPRKNKRNNYGTRLNNKNKK